MSGHKSMDDKGLINILEAIKNAKRSYRDKAAMAILQNPKLIGQLIDKIFDINDPLHIKAAWVFELVCLENISLLDQHIHQFVNGMPSLKHESALRPVSKICSIWCKRYFSEMNTRVELTKADIEQIVSCNFDWLIEDHKVATQVFAMDTLFLCGSEEDWIHLELKSVLQKNAEAGSSGYRAHARKLLKNL